MKRRLQLLLLIAGAFAGPLLGQPVLEPGDVIVSSERPALDPEGVPYVVGVLTVFGRDGVLKGELAVVSDGPPAEPLYRNGIIYVATGTPRGIQRVDSSGTVLTPFQSDHLVVFLAPGPSGGLLATNKSGEVFQFAADGTVIRHRDVLDEPRGDGGIELAADQCTAFYVGCCALVRWDLCNDAPPVFITPPLAAGIGWIRLRTDGTFIVVPLSEEAILHVDQAGNVLHDYGFVGAGMALDIDGTSFWTSRAGNLIRVNIATGATLSITPFPGIAGITVVGEPRPGLLLSATGSDIPLLSPTVLAVLAVTLAGIAVFQVRRFGG